jgi:hypothetical protein
MEPNGWFENHIRWPVWYLSEIEDRRPTLAELNALFDEVSEEMVDDLPLPDDRGQRIVLGPTWFTVVSSSMGMSTLDILNMMSFNGLRPATYEELIAFWKTGLWKEQPFYNHPLVAAGTEIEGGRISFPTIWCLTDEDPGPWHLSPCHAGDIDEDYDFLAVPIKK